MGAEQKKKKNEQEKLEEIKQITEKALNDVEPGLKEWEDGRLCTLLQALRSIRKKFE